MRNVAVMRTPISTPFVCASCGLGNEDREFFVDLGFDRESRSAESPAIVLDGVAYLCDMCIMSLFGDTLRAMYMQKDNYVQVDEDVIDYKKLAQDLELRVDVLTSNCNALEDELKELRVSEGTLIITDEPPVGSFVPETGDEIISKFLGEEVDTGNFTIGTDNFTATADDSTDESDDSDDVTDDGADSGDESLSTLKLGSLD